MSMFQGPTWSKGPAFWLRITAWFELTLAGVFALIGFVVPVTRTGMWITALFLGLTGLGLRAWAGRAQRSFEDAQRIRSTGIPGEADITSMRQTGVVLNSINPQVEMQLSVRLSDGRAPYMVTLKEFVPGVMVGRLTSGQPLPVMADLADPSRVVVLWDQSLQAPVAPHDLDEQIDEQRAWMREHGIPAEAVVISARDTGRDVGDERLFDLDIEVTADDGRPPWRSRSPAAVPAGYVDRVRPGARVPVLLDPNQPQRVMLQWEDAR